ncbi:unnamed protein product [Adineta steineri]|uniref:G-protein coupled receptors family 1 profile domain-containing protein n=2 Tax=Adineta steineri TaxID=433720 RepID=A0A813Y3T1_9BILA|nr:unnamed protein product [Adineta steineri]CAF3756432.1 unnamed protein product [Adineta steineri]
MSSSSLITTLNSITREINIFAGISIFIIGIIGGLLTIIVFLSLQTFRHSSCAFYLTVMSFVNIVQLIIGLLSRSTNNISGIDWTQSSLFYCKFRNYLLVVCTDISMLCMCLATIDQYFATCHKPRWQRLSNLKLARLMSSISAIFSILTSIPCLIYYNQYISPTTGILTCMVTDTFFIQLNIYFYRLIMSNILPLFITLVFGLLTYRNVKQIAHRTAPLVQRELDKQLTMMILIQDIFTFITLLPIMTLGFISLNPNTTRNPVIEAQFQLANVIAVMFYYLYFSSPFYVYICVSERFRQQLKYVLLDNHLHRWRQRKINVNQIFPQT